jgi:hypothetical protein
VPGWQAFTSLLSQQTSATRSTALTPLAWLLGILLSGDCLLVRLGAPTWLVVLVSVLTTACIPAYLYAYFYLLTNDRDALRSERFSLGKIAIEKGIVGDDLTGVLEIDQDARSERTQIANE